MTVSWDWDDLQTVPYGLQGISSRRNSISSVASLDFNWKFHCKTTATPLCVSGATLLINVTWRLSSRYSLAHVKIQHTEYLNLTRQCLSGSSCTTACNTRAADPIHSESDPDPIFQGRPDPNTTKAWPVFRIRKIFLLLLRIRILKSVSWLYRSGSYISYSDRNFVNTSFYC